MTDCVTRKKQWIEITVENLSSDEGIHDLGQWLVNSLAVMTDTQIAHNTEENCLHLHTISLTQEEFDALEVESLLESNGSDSTH